MTRITSHVDHRDNAALERLLRGLRDSDSAALAELFDLFHAPLYRYAARFVGRHEALDVVQDVFLKLWDMREALAIRVSIQSLLYRMTRNRALNVNRKLRRVELTSELPRHAAADTSDAELDAERLRTALRGWIDALPPRRAEAFLLSRYHDLTHEQISRIMGLSIRTVQTHIVHALRDLRAAMAQWEEAPKSAEAQ